MDGVKAKTFDRLDGDDEGGTEAAKCEYPAGSPAETSLSIVRRRLSSSRRLTDPLSTLLSST